MTDGERLEAVRRLLHLADAYGLTELVAEEDGFRVTVRGSDQAGLPIRSTNPSAAAPVEAADSELSRFHPVVSPITGVFYRSPSPDAPPFLEIGDRVEEGQTIGLIEAMKVFSEIPADGSGRVVRVLAQSGKLVNQGDTLMLLDPES
jgi:acetyl-CoA carboxylase biotin carboxyl carrier protein